MGLGVERAVGAPVLVGILRLEDVGAAPWQLLVDLLGLHAGAAHVEIRKFGGGVFGPGSWTRQTLTLLCSCANSVITDALLSATACLAPQETDCSGMER